MRKFAIYATLPLALFAASAARADTIAAVAEKAGTFKTLLAAASAAGLADALTAPGSLTVFAPSDDAFAALPAGTVEELLKPENKDKLAGILKYHVVGSKIMAADIKDGTTEVATLKDTGDMTISVVKGADGVMVDGAKVVAADIAADNGVIHVIDKVILPSD